MTRGSNWIFNSVLAAAVGIMLFFLLTEHTAHFFGALPWLFLLACPFMHLFMHRGGHGSHYGHDNQDNNDDNESQHLAH